MAHFCMIAIPLLALFAARLFLAPYLVDWVSRLVHGSSTWMFAVGWATEAFAPAAALILLLDGNRRERQLGDNPRKRPRTGRGHGVPGRGSGYWIRRLPLILVLVVAAAFSPLRGARGPFVWQGTLGGDSFRQGWQLSFWAGLLCLVALLIFRLVAFSPNPRGDRLLRIAGPVVAVLPAFTLFGLHGFTH